MNIAKIKIKNLPVKKFTFNPKRWVPSFGLRSLKHRTRISASGIVEVLAPGALAERRGKRVEIRLDVVDFTP